MGDRRWNRLERGFLLASHQVGVHHALLQFASDAIACEVAKNLVGVWKGGCRTFACYHVAILLEEGSCVFGACAEILLEAWVAGCLLAIQNAGACQNHRGSADGADSLASLVLCDESLAYTLVLVEMTAARHSTRQEEHIGIFEALDVLKLEVSLDGDAVGSLYPLTSSDTYSLDIHATSAQDVNKSQTFDFLEAVGKKFIYLSHNFIFFIA